MHVCKHRRTKHYRYAYNNHITKYTLPIVHMNCLNITNATIVKPNRTDNSSLQTVAKMANLV